MKDGGAGHTRATKNGVREVSKGWPRPPPSPANHRPVPANLFIPRRGGKGEENLTFPAFPPQLPSPHASLSLHRYLNTSLTPYYP